MTSRVKAGFGVVVVALAMAQFIMTVDTTIMNVSVPTLVNDLNTTVGSVQLAITLYALVMASLMMIGGRLGELYGRKKMFQIGLLIYGTGSAITAIAPNITILILGWSILEGIGASLMMPAMMALISMNFKGRQRISALGIVAGVAGAAAALGPIIGGALSTYASWRYAFLGEVVIAVTTLFLSKNIYDAKVKTSEKLDYKGSVLAALGLSIFVAGILQAGTYGWVRAIQPITIGSVELDLFGISIVPFICGFGILLLWRFFVYQKRQASNNKPFLLKVSLLKIISLRSGLTVVLTTQLVLAGTLFVMPLFLQLVLGYSAIKSGIALLPMSVALIAVSVLGPKLLRNKEAIDGVRIGQILIIAGLIWLLLIISNTTTPISLLLPFFVLGAGIGFVIPMIQTILLGSVEDKDSSQAAGLNYTYQQLGMSLGTAVIGSILIFSLGSGIVKGLGYSDVFNQSVIQQNSVAISSNVQFVSNAQLQDALNTSDLSQQQQQDLIAINSEARIRALRVAVGTAAVFAILSMAASGKIKDALAIVHKKSRATA